MTHSQMAAIVRDYTAKAVTEALTPVLDLNKALELRVLELETRPVVVPEKGEPGRPGEPGQKGLDGAGIASLLVSADARLVAHLTDGRTLDAGPVPRGTDGAPGAAGTPGQKGLDGAPGVPGRDADPGLDPVEIEATFSGLLRKELDALETATPRLTQKRIEKSGTGFTVTEVAV